jgi:hypothetical protein
MVTKPSIQHLMSVALAAAFLFVACDQDMDKTKKKAKSDDAPAGDEGGTPPPADDGGAGEAGGATEAGAPEAGGGEAEAGTGEAEAGEAEAGEAEAGTPAEGDDLEVEIKKPLKRASTKFFVKKGDGEFEEVTGDVVGLCTNGAETELAFKADSDKVDDGELGESDMVVAERKDDDTIEVFFESDNTLSIVFDSLTPNDEKITLTCPDGLTLTGMDDE